MTYAEGKLSPKDEFVSSDPLRFKSFDDLLLKLILIPKLFLKKDHHLRQKSIMYKFDAFLGYLPNCSHRSRFLPIWSFWLFWYWGRWWTLFVFSYIFESDHQTVSIWTIEILKNHFTLMKYVVLYI